MNSNQWAILYKLAEKNQWQQYCQYFNDEFGHLEFYNKIQKIHFPEDQTANIKHSIRKNMMKWIMYSTANTWLIEENKDVIAKELVDGYLEYLHPDQLVTLTKYFTEQNSLENAKICFLKLWSYAPCIRVNEDFELLLGLIKQYKNLHISFMGLIFAIDSGQQDVARKIYSIFYEQYFSEYDLEDEVAILWEHIWSRLNGVGEKWLMWDLLKLDVGLITDIIIKNKTGLQIPHFRKKRELAQAVLLVGDWSSLSSTLIKYFHNIGNIDLIKNWISYLYERKTKCDIDSQLIIKEHSLNKPNIIPKAESFLEDDALNVTQIFNESQNNESQDYTMIKQKLEMLVLPKENLKVTSFDQLPSASWKEKIDTLMMHKEYEAVLTLLADCKNNIAEDEKIDYEIFEMETMIKLSKYNEVLSMLEGAWKGVQELEVFKVLKYIEGEALWMLNRKREASDCFRKVVDIDPNYKLAKWRLIENSL